MEEVPRKSLYAATMALMDEVGQTDELICEKGPAVTWHHANPQALLQLFIQQSRPWPTPSNKSVRNGRAHSLHRGA